MILGPDSTSTDIAEHIERLRRLEAALHDDPGPNGMDSDGLFGCAEPPRRIEREPGEHEAHRYLARKRAESADTSFARAQRWLTVALLFAALAGATLAVAVYADPVGRLAHDTARPKYCGAC